MDSGNRNMNMQNFYPKHTQIQYTNPGNMRGFDPSQFHQAQWVKQKHQQPIVPYRPSTPPVQAPKGRKIEILVYDSIPPGHQLQETCRTYACTNKPSESDGFLKSGSAYHKLNWTICDEHYSQRKASLCAYRDFINGTICKHHCKARDIEKGLYEQVCELHWEYIRQNPRKGLRPEINPYCGKCKNKFAEVCLENGAWRGRCKECREYRENKN